MKKKINFYIFKYFILVVIFFSLIKSTDFLKKVYFTNKYNYEQRIAKSYNYCNDESIAFLHFLKKKYNFKNEIKIIDYKINPNPKWFFFNLKDKQVKQNQDRLILLNYKKQQNINFSKLKDGLFVSEVAPPYIFEIEKAIFTNTESIKKINLEIINKAENENQILLSKSFILEDFSNELDLNLDLEKLNLESYI